MARPPKIGVDYFPHDVVSGKTMFTLEAEYGNDGYAFWFKLLEILGAQPGHVFDTRNPADWRFLVAKTRLTVETATAILNLLAELDAIDTALWEQQRIIWVQKFVNRLADVYKKRGVSTPQKPLLEPETQHDKRFCDGNPASPDIPVPDSTQSKVKETKGNLSTGSLDQDSRAREETQNAAATATAEEILEQKQGLRDVYDCYEQNISTISPIISDDVRYYAIDQGISADVIKAAICEAVSNNSRNWAYVRSILNRCATQRITTLELWQLDRKKKSGKKGKRAPPRDFSDPAYYEQRGK